MDDPKQPSLDGVFSEVRQEYVPKIYTPKVKKVRGVESRDQISPFMAQIVTDAPPDEEEPPILGWRGWKPGTIVGDGRLLKAVSQSNVQWAKRDLVGECKRGKYGNRSGVNVLCTEHLLNLRVGGRRDCQCGIHTLKSPADLPAYAKPRVNYRTVGGGVRWTEPYSVIGAVSVFGTVVETQLGYLSDRACIEALFVCPPSFNAEDRCPTCPPCQCPPIITDEMEQDAERYRVQFGVPVQIVSVGQLLAQL